MKKLLLSLIVVLSSTVMFAQSNVNELMDKFRGREDVNVISISGSMFKMGANFIDEKDEEAKMAKSVASQIEQMDIVNTNSEKGSVELRSEVQKLLKKQKYEEMMTVDSEGEKVKFYGILNGEILKEFFIFVEDKREATLISMKGNINPKNIGKLMEKTKVN